MFSTITKWELRFTNLYLLSLFTVNPLGAEHSQLSYKIQSLKLSSLNLENRDPSNHSKVRRTILSE